MGPQGPPGEGLTDEQLQLMNALLTGAVTNLTPEQTENLRLVFLRSFEGTGSVLDSAYQASVARRNTEVENRLSTLEAQADPEALEQQVADLQNQVNQLLSRLEALESQ